MTALSEEETHTYGDGASKKFAKVLKYVHWKHGVLPIHMKGFFAAVAEAFDNRVDFSVTHKITLKRMFAEAQYDDAKAMDADPQTLATIRAGIEAYKKTLDNFKEGEGVAKAVQP